jgi:hypothetical protein
VKGWAVLDKIEGLTRTQILDGNDWLDALEEAEDLAQKKAQMSKTNPERMTP